jgi:hypothetical protein
VDFFVDQSYLHATTDRNQIPMTKKLPQTKVSQVIQLCRRKAGVSITDISKKLGVTKVAAGSLISDARRKGKRVRRKMDADGVSRYYV